MIRATPPPGRSQRYGARKVVSGMTSSTAPAASRRRRLLTPRNILVGLAIFVVGSFIGVGLFTFGFANGWAYFGTEPETCAQCHVMNDQYEDYLKGSHKDVATCNDCHMPHDNVVHKYAVKAETGFRHAAVFTANSMDENIQMVPKSQEVTINSCLYCHGDFVADIHMGRLDGEPTNCLQCHSEVGHK